MDEKDPARGGTARRHGNPAQAEPRNPRLTTESSRNAGPARRQRGCMSLRLRNGPGRHTKLNGLTR